MGTIITVLYAGEVTSLALVVYDFISYPVTPWSLICNIIISPWIDSVQEKISNTEYSRSKHGYTVFD